MLDSVRIHQGTDKETTVTLGDKLDLEIKGKTVAGEVTAIEKANESGAEYEFTVRLEHTVEFSWESYLCYTDKCKVSSTDVDHVA